MQRSHSMPFGAQVLDNGSVRFRLWAPGARLVELALDTPSGEVCRTLAGPRDGWYEIVTDAAHVGSRYRFRIDANLCVPDPASRHQPEDVHGVSEVVDPRAYAWQDRGWRGRLWEEAVLYELHVGSFSPEGTFDGVRRRLDYLADLGVTAIELMPVADFPGTRNWGYDGVLPFAPDSRYGRPEDLKRLVDAAHARGLMMFLDVVYNHFGPEGNYLHVYAKKFFTDRHHTPWGAAINFDGADSRVVRDFFIHNALYWLEEYHLDGLRLDAVHAIIDDSRPDILEELAETVHTQIGADRHVHLVLENEHNQSRYLQRDTEGRARHYVAQWNDDIHHVWHVLVTGEHGGYYADYADKPLVQLGRCLTEGFAYQNDPSAYRGGARRGEVSRGLPPTAFVSFLQNHDQIGNRAFGERLTQLAAPEALRAMTAILLLAPQPPLLFMGEEWGARQPFPFFCDFGPDLAAAVTAGRRKEFARFPQFSDPAARERIPDPNAEATFASAVLDWQAKDTKAHAPWLQLYRDLLALRRRLITPRLAGMPGEAAGFEQLSAHVLRIDWTLNDGSRLSLHANLGSDSAEAALPGGTPLFASNAVPAGGKLPGWTVVWFLEPPRA